MSDFNELASEFLAQKRIAVAGVSRKEGKRPTVSIARCVIKATLSLR